jgi:hypothetical protein
MVNRFLSSMGITLDNFGAKALRSGTAEDNAKPPKVMMLIVHLDLASTRQT